MDNGTFGRRLQKERKKRGMSRDFLAKQADITVSCLKNMEDDIPPFPDVIERLAMALDTTVEYLRTGENPILTRSLQNLESYVKEKAINNEEAEFLRNQVVEKASLRASAPQGTIDFDNLRKIHKRQQPISGLCWRCRYGITSDTGYCCPNCGSLWDAPDN